MKLIIESTNKSDTEIDIEEKLEKALNSIRLQREGKKQFQDPYLKQLKDESDVVIKKVLDNMIDEIEKVLVGGK